MTRYSFNRRIKETLIVFIISFFLNFLWESVHAIFLYEGIADYSAHAFVRLISYASLIDAICVAFIFLAGCFVFRKNWVKLDAKQILFTAVIGILIAVVIEERALLAHRWSYTPLMPTIFGIGISPLVQLAITGIISLLVLSKIQT